MGVTVQIGSDERAFSDVTESWIHDQIGRRQRDNISVCIIVKIQEAGLSLQFATPGCNPSSGSGRGLNPEEQKIADLWIQQKLNTSDFSIGSVTAFLRELRRLV